MTLPEMLISLDLDVAPEAVLRLEMLVDELLRWNARRNLTAITDRCEVLEKHLVDSLTLLPDARKAKSLLDIGSGAGFPALPLKIACPDLSVVSVDAVGKKVDFQRHVARILGLTDFVAWHGRIEDLQDHTEYRTGFDLVTARALCNLDALLARAKPFLAPDGHLVAMKGPDGLREFRLLQDQLHQDGWTASLSSLVLPVSGSERCLIHLRR
jgi:16S rRNA (guanine527-N7)-methyltransferase